jgi:hypothetical protein
VLGLGLGHCQRNSQNRIGAEFAFTRGAIHLNHEPVDRRLIPRLLPANAAPGSDSRSPPPWQRPFPRSACHHPLSSIASCSPVDAPDGTLLALNTILEMNFDLHRWLPSEVKNFPSVNFVFSSMTSENLVTRTKA